MGRIKKIYETKVNISPVEIYSDLDQVVLEKLKQNFEGKCRENSLIVNVISIQERSMCTISKSHLDGSGSVNVKYLAEAITYEVFDILPVCEIIRIEKNHTIMCNYSDHTIVKIKGSIKLSSLKIGQKIPVLVLNSRCKKEKKSIVVSGIPYTYPNRFYMFTASTSEIKDDEKEIIKAALAELAGEKELLSKSNKKIVKFFTDLFYPFKKKSEDLHKLLPKETSEIHMDDLENFDELLTEDNLYFRHHVTDMISDEILCIPINKFDPAVGGLLDAEIFKYQIVAESPVVILTTLINDHIKYVRFIREWVEEFSSEQKISDQNNIWDIYINLKK